MHISQTTKLIFFKFGMYSRVYGGHKYASLIEIGPVVIEIQGVENVDFVVPVNDTLVCHTSFIATDI